MTGRRGLGVHPTLWRREPAAPGAGAHVVGVLSGEGIGPEVVGVALEVLSALEATGAARFRIRVGPEPPPPDPDADGGLDPLEARFCHEVFAEEGALLCGPRGGRFVYDLRRRFDLFCKLTPVRPLPCLRDAGALRPEAVRDVDLLFVRENVSGLYFGSGQERREGGVLEAVHHGFRYERATVERIVRVAAALAAERRGRLAVVVKTAGIPSVSALWRECARAVCGTAGVALDLLEVDNAAYQVVADARRFDVVVSPNMFGDVLADVAALLLGSRGLSWSANFGADGRAAYQTAHGAARDLAGTDRANPVGQLHALAALLEESCGRGDLAHAVHRATQAVLAEGWRTPDVMAPGCTPVGTRELGKRIADRVQGAAAPPGPGR